MANQVDDDEDIAEELAIERLTMDGADRDVASSFLRAKTALLRTQLRQLHISHFREGLYAAAEIVIGLVILLIFVGLTSAVWSAAHDNGLVIESFSVPPDFAARGLDGQVVASQLLDRLSVMQAQTVSNRAASSYTNNWGTDIKVQIPDTGVSIGDVNRYLRDWLGNETHISGDVFRDGDKITVTARVSSGATASFSGAPSEFDSLMQKAAEAVYRTTQPYRYAVYLDSHNRTPEAAAVYQHLLSTGSVEERAWAYIGLASEAAAANDLPRGDALLRQSLAIKPDMLLAYSNLANNEGTLQHDEPALYYARAAVTLAAHQRDTSMNRLNFEVTKLQNQQSVDVSLGDIQAGMADIRALRALPDTNNSTFNALASDMVSCGLLHDDGCLQSVEHQLAPKDANEDLNFRGALQLGEFNLHHWRGVMEQAKALLPALKKLGPPGDTFQKVGEDPLLARAELETGNLAEAHRIIDETPTDCIICLRQRGAIDAAEKNWRGAEFWLARAVRLAPSEPFIEDDWGRVLLAKGDAKGAIAKFKAASLKGPRFADPLEGWGEALIAQNRSDLALAKFEDAAKYAPHWGRLHLKWGQALWWSGDKAGARKEFDTAAHFDLTPAETAELSHARSAHG